MIDLIAVSDSIIFSSKSDLAIFRPHAMVLQHCEGVSQWVCGIAKRSYNTIRIDDGQRVYMFARGYRNSSGALRGGLAMVLFCFIVNGSCNAVAWDF